MKSKFLKEKQKMNITKNDISKDWIKNCEPLKKLSKKILLINFKEEFSKKNIEVEFRILKRITNTNLHVKKMFKKGLEKFCDKNRYRHIIPFTHSMPKCFCDIKKKKKNEDEDEKNKKKGFEGFYSNLNDFDKKKSFISEIFDKSYKKNTQEDYEEIAKSDFLDNSEIKLDIKNESIIEIENKFEKDDFEKKNNKNKNSKFDKFSNENKFSNDNKFLKENKFDKFSSEKKIDKSCKFSNDNKFDDFSNSNNNSKFDEFSSSKNLSNFSKNKFDKFSNNKSCLFSPMDFSKKSSKFNKLSFSPSNFSNKKSSKFSMSNFSKKKNIKNINLDFNEDFYINADYINHPLCDSSNSYIVTQFPKKNSVEDFWHLIFENEIKYVIMLNNLNEDALCRKEKYFPKNGKKFEKGIFEVKNLGELSAEFVSFKKIEIKLLEENLEKNKKDEIMPKQVLNQELSLNLEKAEKINKIPCISVKQASIQKIQTVIHYNLKTWIDHSTIKKSEYPLLLEFIKLISKQLQNENIKKKQKNKPPILIHCKAGIGRSGCFLAILFIYEYFLELKEIYGKNFFLDKKIIEDNEIGISIFSIVRQLREDRWGMVEKPKQYFFLYDFCGYMIENFESIN